MHTPTGVKIRWWNRAFFAWLFELGILILVAGCGSSPTIPLALEPQLQGGSIIVSTQ